MPTVLVVDDSQIARRVAGRVVESAIDARVTYAVDGEAAIAELDREIPDVVITDLMMPKMDGLQLVSKIKERYPQIPVILMTDKGNEDIAAEALRRGAASYVPKKRLEDDLAETLARVLIAAREPASQSRLMHHMTDDESNYVLYNDVGLIQCMVSHLQQLLRCLPLVDETERLRVGLALEEALNNALYHGNLEIGPTFGVVDRGKCIQLSEQRIHDAPYRNRRIYVRASITRENALFVVRDEGPGFDTSTVPTIGEESEQTGRRGIILMRSIMDEVSYNDRGNEVTLTKHRAAESVLEDRLDEADD